MRRSTPAEADLVDAQLANEKEETMAIGVATMDTFPRRLGRRSSWGALLSGALTTLVVATILWFFGLAITLIAGGGRHWAGTLMALWIVAIGVTLVGSVVGGLVSGNLLGGPSRLLGGLHGALSVGLAFLISTMSLMFISATVMSWVGSAAATTVQTAGNTVSGAGTPSSKAENLLRGLGYPPAQARDMVAGAQSSVQHMFNKQVRQGQAASAASTLKDYVAATTWIYGGTWLVASLLGFGFGMLGNGFAFHPEEEETLRRRELPEGTPPEPTPPGRPFPPPLRPSEV